MANITIDTSAKLNLDMEAMTSTTKAKYDVFNTKYKQILENDNALNTSIQEATDSVNKSITDLKTTTENSIQELEESVDDKFEQRKKSIHHTHD